MEIVYKLYDQLFETQKKQLNKCENNNIRMFSEKKQRIRKTKCHP